MMEVCFELMKIGGSYCLNEHGGKYDNNEEDSDDEDYYEC